MGRGTRDEVRPTQVHIHSLNKITLEKHQGNAKLRACYRKPDAIGQNPESAPGLEAQLQSPSDRHQDKNGDKAERTPPNNRIHLRSDTFEGWTSLSGYYTRIAHLWSDRMA